MKILVIDDDPEILQLVAQFLTLSAHHDVQTAISARAALDLVEQAPQPFDCFLVDIQMRGVDGISLIELLRETPTYRHTPILMLTAMQDKSYIDRAFSAGATDYVVKPFDFSDLDQRLTAAAELILERAAVEDASARVGEAESAPPAHKAPTLESPLALPGVGAGIDFGEFLNYVRQLRRRRSSDALVMAVKIGAIAHLFAHTSAKEFQTIIGNVALAVEQTLLPKGGMLTYAGDGIYYCIPNGRIKGHRKAMQKALNKRFQTEHPPSEGVALSLFLGDQIPLTAGPDDHLLAPMHLSETSMDKESSAQEHVFALPKFSEKRKRIFSLH